MNDKVKAQRELSRIRIKEKDKYWVHYCPVDKTVISNLKGEPCNWCDTKED